MGMCVSKQQRDVLRAVQEVSPPSLGNARLMGQAEIWEEYEYVYEYDANGVSTPLVLGSGLSGPVYLVRSKIHPEMQFALKELAKEKVPFRVNETSIYLLMDHPNIAKIFEVYQGPSTMHSSPSSSSSIFLLNEACVGGELFSILLQEKRFNEISANHLVRQILKALNYMHNLGIVHGDLKLENFVFDRKGTVFSSVLKMIDFGFSRQTAPRLSSPRTTKRGGTPIYMAPEKLAAVGPDTPMGDMWSMGVIAFMLLTGHSPFGGATVAEVEKAITRTDLPSLFREYNFLTPEAIDFLTKCFAPNPSSRLTARGALDHPWLALIGARRTKATMEDLKRVAASMIGFAAEKPLRRACMGLIGLHIFSPRSPLTIEVFDMIDKQQDGFLMESEIGWFLDLYTPNGLRHTNLHEIFFALDLTGDGRINFSEFLAATEVFPVLPTVSRTLIESVFRKFDRDGSGCITQANLQALFGSRGYKGARIDALIAEADFFGDGVVSLDEFDMLVRGTRGLVD
jgi:calcium-dependent protein kinase